MKRSVDVIGRFNHDIPGYLRSLYRDVRYIAEMYLTLLNIAHLIESICDLTG